MRIDNSLKTQQVRMYYLLLLIMIGILACVNLYYWLTNDNEFSIVFALWLVCIVAYGVLRLLNYNYVCYDDQQKKIIIRFFNIHPFLRKYQSIEIPKDKLASFDIRKTFFNIRTQLFVFQKGAKGVMQYPPVEITGLSKVQRKELQTALTRLLKGS